MTTIAYRDGCLAADTLVSVQTHRDGYATKIAKLGPYLAGASGYHAMTLKFLDWFRMGMPADRTPEMGMNRDEKYDTYGHIFCPDGLIVTFSPLGWTKRRAPYYATGSGCDYAYGAMSMGATAEEAVRAALVHETASGGPITVLWHWD